MELPLAPLDESYMHAYDFPEGPQPVSPYESSPTDSQPSSWFNLSSTIGRYSPNGFTDNGYSSTATPFFDEKDILDIHARPLINSHVSSPAQIYEDTKPSPEFFPWSINPREIWSSGPLLLSSTLNHEPACQPEASSRRQAQGPFNEVLIENQYESPRSNLRRLSGLNIDELDKQSTKKRRRRGPARKESGERTGSEDLTLDRQRERNRLAAERCRRKQIDRTQILVDTVNDLQQRRDSLQSTVGTLGAQVLSLKEELLRHNDCGCEPIRHYLDFQLEQILVRPEQRHSIPAAKIEHEKRRWEE